MNIETLHLIGGKFWNDFCLNGHVSCTLSTFRPNRRASGRKVIFAIRWQVREGHLTILVHWGYIAIPLIKQGGKVSFPLSLKLFMNFEPLL